MKVSFKSAVDCSDFQIFQIPVGIRDDEQEELLRSDDLEYSGTSSNGSGKRSCMARIWKGLDSKLMKPLLTSSRPSLVETLPNFCSPCAHFLTSEEQMGLGEPMTDTDQFNLPVGQQAYAMSDTVITESVGVSLSSGD